MGWIFGIVFLQKNILCEVNLCSMDIAINYQNFSKCFNHDKKERIFEKYAKLKEGDKKATF